MDEISPTNNSKHSKTLVEAVASNCILKEYVVYSINGNNVIDFKEHSKKDDVCEFLEYIRRDNPIKKIILIMDNFRSHWANKTRKKAKDLDISIVFLPPYSPDLNPIEFIWRSIKRRISAIFIESVDHLKTVIREAFVRLASFFVLREELDKCIFRS